MMGERQTSAKAAAEKALVSVQPEPNGKAIKSKLPEEGRSQSSSSSSATDAKKGWTIEDS
jgi:hypothetical protein